MTEAMAGRCRTFGGGMGRRAFSALVFVLASRFSDAQQPAAPDPVSDAMAKIYRQLSDVDVPTAKLQAAAAITNPEIALISTHQMLAFRDVLNYQKTSEERLQFLLNTFVNFEGVGRAGARGVAGLAELGNPYFSALVQEHPLQIAAAFAELGIPLNRSLAVRNVRITLRHLIETEAQGRTGEAAIQGDTSDLILALSYVTTLDVAWKNAVAENPLSIASFVEEPLKTWRAILTEPETTPLQKAVKIFSTPLADIGIPFAKALSALVVKFANSQRSSAAIASYEEVLRLALTSEFEPLLPVFSAQLGTALERLRTGQEQRDAMTVLADLRFLSAMVLLALEPGGYYVGKFPRGEVAKAVGALADAASAWYSASFDRARQTVASSAWKMDDKFNTSVPVALKVAFLDVYRALSLWKAAGRPAVAASPHPLDLFASA